MPKGVSTSEATDVPVSEDVLRLLRALAEAAIFVSSRGLIVAANAAARAALGLEAERPEGCDLIDLSDEPPERVRETLRTWSRSTAPSPGSFTVTRGESATIFNAKGCLVFPQSEQAPSTLLVRFWSRAEANPFLLLNQKLLQLNDEVARRIRVEEALRESESALRERAQEAEALNRAKDEFLATVSHELRTPLNAILGWSSLLRERPLDEKVNKAVEVIFRNARAQATLIDDILDVSRIITGKLLIEPAPCDLVAIVEEEVEVVRPSAAAKKIAVTLVRPEELCLLIVDADRIKQVLWNLLSNAIKFTERGGSVRIEVGRHGSQILLSVADTGQGIDPAFLPHVFDRFKQADSSTTRRIGGLGLGLALVRHIVEMHGGTVAVESEGIGRGARFTVRLPVRAVQPTPTPAVAPDEPAVVPQPNDPARLAGVRVLVVDDEPDARDVVAEVLRLDGGEIETADSAAEAFEAAVRFRPHVIVSDIGMPVEDGYSFISRLRCIDEAAVGSIPAIALTAYTRPEDRTKALAAGFTTHIGKPVNPEDLLAAIANLARLAPR